jgi:hypothetical protein
MFDTELKMTALRCSHLTEENVMPVFVIPLLVGIPVIIIGGGYFIIQAMHH